MPATGLNDIRERYEVRGPHLWPKAMLLSSEHNSKNGAQAHAILTKTFGFDRQVSPIV